MFTLKTLVSLLFPNGVSPRNLLWKKRNIALIFKFMFGSDYWIQAKAICYFIFTKYAHFNVTEHKFPDNTNDNSEVVNTTSNKFQQFHSRYAYWFSKLNRLLWVFMCWMLSFFLNQLSTMSVPQCTTLLSFLHSQIYL